MLPPSGSRRIEDNRAGAGTSSSKHASDFGIVSRSTKLLFASCCLGLIGLGPVSGQTNTCVDGALCPVNFTPLRRAEREDQVLGDL